jgi:hypothetical protein
MNGALIVSQQPISSISFFGLSNGNQSPANAGDLT